jgi:hypothetical protein
LTREFAEFFAGSLWVSALALGYAALLLINDTFFHVALFL